VFCGYKFREYDTFMEITWNFKSPKKKFFTGSVRSVSKFIAPNFVERDVKACDEIHVNNFIVFVIVKDFLSKNQNADIVRRVIYPKLS
jgi:hypothetical protein